MLSPKKKLSQEILTPAEKARIKKAQATDKKKLAKEKPFPRKGVSQYKKGGGVKALKTAPTGYMKKGGTIKVKSKK